MPRDLALDDSFVVVEDVEHDLRDAYADLRIDENHVIAELRDQPSHYAYWSTLAEDATAEAERRRRKLEIVEAELDAELRKEARLNHEKVTEPLIERRILREEKYEQALLRYLEAKRASGHLNVIRRAWEQRLSALIAMNNRDRAEMRSIGREAD